MALAMHIFHTPSRCYIDCMDWLNITYRTHRQFPNVTPVQALIPDMIKLTQRMLVRTWQRSYWETIWQGTLGRTLFWRLPQYPHLWIGISWYGPCFSNFKGCNCMDWFKQLRPNLPAEFQRLHQWSPASQRNETWLSMWTYVFITYKDINLNLYGCILMFGLWWPYVVYWIPLGPGKVRSRQTFWRRWLDVFGPKEMLAETLHDLSEGPLVPHWKLA